jgi:hypothetical protein
LLTIILLSLVTPIVVMLTIIRLSVMMLTIIMLSVIMLSVVMLNVVTPILFAHVLVIFELLAPLKQNLNKILFVDRTGQDRRKKKR